MFYFIGGWRNVFHRIFLGIDVVPVDESQASTFQNKRSTGWIELIRLTGFNRLNSIFDFRSARWFVARTSTWSIGRRARINWRLLQTLSSFSTPSIECLKTIPLNRHPWTPSSAYSSRLDQGFLVSLNDEFIQSVFSTHRRLNKWTASYFCQPIFDLPFDSQVNVSTQRALST